MACVYTHTHTHMSVCVSVYIRAAWYILLSLSDWCIRSCVTFKEIWPTRLSLTALDAHLQVTECDWGHRRCREWGGGVTEGATETCGEMWAERNWRVKEKNSTSGGWKCFGLPVMSCYEPGLLWFSVSSALLTSTCHFPIFELITQCVQIVYFPQSHTGGNCSWINMLAEKNVKWLQWETCRSISILLFTFIYVAISIFTYFTNLTFISTIQLPENVSAVHVFQPQQWFIFYNFQFMWFTSCFSVTVAAAASCSSFNQSILLERKYST